MRWAKKNTDEEGWMHYADNNAVNAFATKIQAEKRKKGYSDAEEGASR